MIVRMVVSVEVDPSEWAAEYSCGSDTKAVREDVFTYFHTYLNNLPDHLPIKDVRVIRTGQRSTESS